MKLFKLLVVDNVIIGIIGTLGSAGHLGGGDVCAVKAGMEAWEHFRQSKRK